MPESLVNLVVALHEEPTTVSERLLRPSDDGESRVALIRLLRELGSLGAAKDARIAVRVDSVTRVGASQTVAVVDADGTVGDKLHIGIPGIGRFTFTAVASSPNALAGEYSLEGSSNSTTALSLRDAIRALCGQYLAAHESSGTVVLGAKVPGSWGNAITLQKAVTTSNHLTLGGATFTGGTDAIDRPTATVTFGAPDIVADDTVTIGSVTLTWKASASTTSEITLSTTPATAATNFVAAINAQPRFRGLLSASLDSSAVARLTWLGDARAGTLVRLARTETNAGSVVLSAGTLGVAITLAFAETTRTHGLGAP